MQRSILKHRRHLATAAACLAMFAGAGSAPANATAPSTNEHEQERSATLVSNAGATIRVDDDAEFAAAAERLRTTGGTIVLAPRSFDELIVRQRSAEPLTIVAEPGATARRVVLDHTRAVRLSGLRISPSPSGPAATVDVVDSRDIELSGFRVTGALTGHAAGLAVERSSRVAVTGSLFERCGEGGFCVRLRETREVSIVNTVFQDCYGCDFLHGRYNRGIEIRGSSFHRALVGSCGRDRERCNHQDLVQLVDGGDVVIDGNSFGVHEFGAAQIYLTGTIHRVAITNNVFLPTDPLAPGRTAETAIWVGNKRTTDVPLEVVIEHNTILTGSVRQGGRANRGTANSILLSPAYEDKPAEHRPLVANNVIALTGTPTRLCDQVRTSVDNVVIAGTPCSASDVLGDPALDALGRPTAYSTLVIDRADPLYATPVDTEGTPRDEKPDIGAFEWMPSAATAIRAGGP